MEQNEEQIFRMVVVWMKQKDERVIQQLTTMIIVAAVCGSFISLEVDIVGDYLTTSYSLDKAAGIAKFYFIIWPQTMYFWNIENPMYIGKLDYSKFSKHGELFLKANFVYACWQGNLVKTIDYHYIKSGA